MNMKSEPCLLVASLSLLRPTIGDAEGRNFHDWRSRINPNAEVESPQTTQRTEREPFRERGQNPFLFDDESARLLPLLAFPCVLCGQSRSWGSNENESGDPETRAHTPRRLAA
jgi:hypothetical protein